MYDISVAEALWAILAISGISMVIYGRRDRFPLRGYAHVLTGIGAIFAGIGGLGRDWDLGPLITAGGIVILIGIAGTTYAWLREEMGSSEKPGAQ